MLLSTEGSIVRPKWGVSGGKSKNNHVNMRVLSKHTEALAEIKLLFDKNYNIFSLEKYAQNVQKKMIERFRFVLQFNTANSFAAGTASQ